MNATNNYTIAISDPTKVAVIRRLYKKYGYIQAKHIAERTDFSNEATIEIGEILGYIRRFMEELCEYDRDFVGLFCQLWKGEGADEFTQEKNI